MDCEPHPSFGGEDPLALSSILGDPRQRRVLVLLLDGAPMTVEELSVQVAAQEAGTAPSAVSRADRRRRQGDLRHRCLPELESVGWIERRPEGIVVDDPEPLETGRLSVPDLRDPEDPIWDAVSAVLARPYRQELVSIVADRDAQVTVAELTADLLDRSPRAPAPEDERALASTLHHADLPTLAEVGLIEYDAGERAVAPTPRLTRFVDRTGLDTGEENP